MSTRDEVIHEETLRITRLVFDSSSTHIERVRASVASAYDHGQRCADAEIELLKAAIERVQELHKPMAPNRQGDTYCEGCSEGGLDIGAALFADCPTLKALRGVN